MSEKVEEAYALTAFGLLDELEKWFLKSKGENKDFERPEIVIERYMNFKKSTSRLEFKWNKSGKIGEFLRLELQLIGEGVFNLYIHTSGLQDTILSILKKEEDLSKEIGKIGNALKAYLLYGIRQLGEEVEGDVDALMSEVRPGYVAPKAKEESNTAEEAQAEEVQV